MDNPSSGFLSGAALKAGGAKQEIVDMVGEELPNPSSDVLERLRGHTPGPWRVHVEPDYSIHRAPSVYICRSDQDWPDAQLARVNTADEFGSQEANARLIAEAPTMLATIERLSAELAWQPIESAPRDGSPIIAYWPHLQRPVVAWVCQNNRNRGQWVASHSTSYSSAIRTNPTHWRPLSDPPALTTVENSQPDAKS